MLARAKKYWFLISLAIAAWLGYAFPGVGETLIRNNVLTAGLVISFFLTGLLLESGAVLNAFHSLRGLYAALLSSLVIFPVFAWLITMPLQSPELTVGCCIIAAGPATISSGTILTAFARGNVSLSVFICIFTHFIGVFSIPLMLGILLGSGVGVELPALTILAGLILKVLVPLSLGQVTKPLLGNLPETYSAPISVFQSCMVLLMVMTAVSSSAERLAEMDSFLAIVIITVAVLHSVMVIFNYLLAKGIRLDQKSLIAFTIHVPQKTLGVSYIVWVGYFSVDYPGAFVPAIVCHLIQMITGTLAAQHFRKRTIATSEHKER